VPCSSGIFYALSLLLTVASNGVVNGIKFYEMCGTGNLVIKFSSLLCNLALKAEVESQQ